MQNVKDFRFSQEIFIIGAAFLFGRALLVPTNRDTHDIAIIVYGIQPIVDARYGYYLFSRGIYFNSILQKTLFSCFDKGQVRLSAVGCIL